MPLPACPLVVGVRHEEVAMSIGITGFSPPTPFRTERSEAAERISSGSRINSARDDAAGLAVASRLSREVDGLSVALRNAGDGISLTQVASGGLESLRNDYSRIRELAVQAGNGTLNASDRKALQEETNQLLGNIQQTLEGTRFNERSLLADDQALSLQVGPNSGDTLSVEGRNLQANLQASGAFELDLSSPEAASETLSRIDESLEQINQRDTEFAAVSNRLSSSIEELSNRREASESARSRVADSDLAAEASRLVADDIRNQASIAVQAQGNAQARSVLSLLS